MKLLLKPTATGLYSPSSATIWCLLCETMVLVSCQLHGSSLCCCWRELCCRHAVSLLSHRQELLRLWRGFPSTRQVAQQHAAATAADTLHLLTWLILLHLLQGVEGVLIAGNDGTIHKTTLNEKLTQEYASQVPALASLARNVVRDLDPQVSCCPARSEGVLVYSS